MRDRAAFHVSRTGADARQPGDKNETDQREIRAVVLSLPDGKVEAEANWLVHDRAQYLWMLRDGHFLLRDRNNLEEGDTSLKLTPLLDFPGPLLSIELDPNQQFLVTNSREPVKPDVKPRRLGTIARCQPQCHRIHPAPTCPTWCCAYCSESPDRYCW